MGYHDVFSAWNAQRERGTKTNLQKEHKTTGLVEIEILDLPLQSQINLQKFNFGNGFNHYDSKKGCGAILYRAIRSAPVGSMNGIPYLAFQNLSFA